MEKVEATQKVQNMLVVILMGKKFIHHRLGNIQIKFRITQIEVEEEVVVVVIAVVLIIDPVAVEITVQAEEVEIETEMAVVAEEVEVEETEIIISEEIIKKNLIKTNDYFRSKQKKIKNSN